ncbi:hypothetical protein E4U55_007670 [Claviceps digitariae]|nr:hypothetical protein E4U55_007670 [Claviceps digitariae]
MSQTPVTESVEHPRTALDVLFCDMNQLVHFLESNKCHDRIDISSLSGVMELSKEQKLKIAERMRIASHLMNPHAINSDDLAARLAKVAEEQNDGNRPEVDMPHSPAKWSHSFASTVSPTEPINFEISSYHELVRDGCRPACSIEDLIYIHEEPLTRCERILPWLSADPDSETGQGQIHTVFTRQFTRWWDFRKSQWVNRGDADADMGLSSFCEASARRYRGAGELRLADDCLVEENMRQLWAFKPTGKQISDGDDDNATAYKKTVTRRLAPFKFKHTLRLKEDPSQQSPWTNWLEYVSYEIWYLGRYKAAAKRLWERHRQAWLELYKDTHESLLVQAEGPDGEGGSSSGGGGPSSPRLMTRPEDEPQAISPRTFMYPELHGLRDRVDSKNRAVYRFLKESQPYVDMQTRTFHQKRRVEWAVKEARLLDEELAQSNSDESPKKSDGTPAGKSRKRHRDEDDVPGPCETKKRVKEDRPLNEELAHPNSDESPNKSDGTPAGKSRKRHRDEVDVPGPGETKRVKEDRPLDEELARSNGDESPDKSDDVTAGKGGERVCNKEGLSAACDTSNGSDGVTAEKSRKRDRNADNCSGPCEITNNSDSATAEESRKRDHVEDDLPGPCDTTNKSDGAAAEASSNPDRDDDDLSGPCDTSNKSDHAAAEASSKPGRDEVNCSGPCEITEKGDDVTAEKGRKLDRDDDHLSAPCEPTNTSDGATAANSRKRDRDDDDDDDLTGACETKRVKPSASHAPDHHPRRYSI